MAGGMMRVLIFDLLAERIEFGHGGNVEMITPLAEQVEELEVFLLTPQYQGLTQFQSAGENELAIMAKLTDMPSWDHAVEFNSEWIDTIAGCTVRWRRILCPKTDKRRLRTWLDRHKIDALYCTGSRRNVSYWEDWMSSVADMLLASHNESIPMLCICFGHQLLAKAFGGRIERAENRTDAVFDLELTSLGNGDSLFDGLCDGDSVPVALFTHQDHVVELPQSEDVVVHLASAPHNRYVAVRALDNNGNLSLTWGVQFHPEASRARIERSLSLGHITQQELEAFKREHDGGRVLSNFAAVVFTTVKESR